MSKFKTDNALFFLNCKLKLILFSFKTPQDHVVDGEALKCMNEDTLKTLVPPTGVRATIIYKLKKLNEEESGRTRSITSGAAAIEDLEEDESRVHGTKSESLILDADRGETSGTIELLRNVSNRSKLTRGNYKSSISHGGEVVMKWHTPL